MEYKNLGGTYYLRMDRNDEILSKILEMCKEESVQSATFSGIGGCCQAEIQTFRPELGRFETDKVEGMLELVSLMGSVFSDTEGSLFHHTHAAFAFQKGQEHCFAAGHLKSATVLYTAEIELRPVQGGVIRRKFDQETGTGFWDFQDENSRGTKSIIG